MNRLLPVAAALLAVSPLAAQSLNTTKLFSSTARGHCAGVWGYSTPDGREFAVVGAQGGTWILETTDPANTKEVGFFTAPSSQWREIAGYKQYIYSVSEGHGGLRIIDMTNPSTPVDRGTVHSSTSWRNTHTISIDPDAGRLYANGSTSNRMWILDAATNPLMPAILGSYTGAYVHDSFIRRGKGYLAEIYGGNLRIVDVTNATSLTTISSTVTPGAFTHNSWVTDDDKLLLTTDENNTGYLQCYDISTPATPVKKGSFVLPGSIVHNVFGIGRTAHIAHYTAGYRMLDISNPDGLKEVAYYDTSSSASGFNGAWGCYPWSDSGHIYVGDRQTGFWVIQVDHGHLNRFKVGTAGLNGKIPRLQFEGQTPMVNANKLEMRMSDCRPNSAWVLVIGAAATDLPVGGFRLYVDITQPHFILTGTLDASGKATLPFPIPSDPGVGGLKLYMQLVTLDAAAPMGLAASRGMWFGIAK
jgi:choice-of-anchor B domain-containing protein